MRPQYTYIPLGPSTWFRVLGGRPEGDDDSGAGEEEAQYVPTYDWCLDDGHNLGKYIARSSLYHFPYFRHFTI